MSTAARRRDGIAERYETALGRYLEAPDDQDALAEGYALGREAADGGLGLLDLFSIHQQTLERILLAAASPDASARLSRQAFAFFSETLAPFEMMHRGFREANAEIRSLNAELEQKVLELREVATIVEATDDAIVASSLAGIILTWNPGAERMYGYRAGEMIGQPVARLIPPERSDELVRIYEPVRRGDSVRLFTTVHLRKDGSSIGVSVTASPILGDDGQPVAAALTTRDVTEQTRVEKQLRQAQKHDALGTLAGGIAHDFNNLLQVIIGYTALVRGELPPDHGAQPALESIESAGARGADLVRRLLSFSRPEDETRQVLDLRPVVDEALKLIRPTLPAMIELRTTFAPQLPPVAMDPSQVHQVIMNLATNAAHAIGRQVGLIEIGLDTVTRAADAGPASSSTAEGRYVRLSLSDNGCGMDAATLERVFDPFFTTKPPGEGTGLGLSLVHGIMLSHGGTVTAYSQPGKGTTFNLHFPVAEAGGVETPEAKAPLPSELPAGRGGRVMIVDDEEDLVELQLLALGRLGYDVVGHTDPARALDAFRARPHDYDVVVTDLSMPSMSGLDLARELLAVRPDLPILISSGYIPPEEQEAARLLGIRGLVTKPDTIGALRDILGRLFETIEVGDV